MSGGFLSLHGQIKSLQIFHGAAEDGSKHGNHVIVIEHILRRVFITALEIRKNNGFSMMKKQVKSYLFEQHAL